MRAALVLAAFRSLGGTSPAIAGVAAAVETVHAYSLVHDDLPVHGRRRPPPRASHHPSPVRRAHRHPRGLPAGTRWPPGCSPAAADELGLPDAGLGRMAATLFEAGGIEGMVGGQWLDLEAEGQTLTLPQLMAVHRGKTGALIRASCTLGGIAAEAGPGDRPRSPPSARTSGSPSRSRTTCWTAPGRARSWARRRAGTRRWPSPPTSDCWVSTAPGGRPSDWPRRAVAQLERAGVPSAALGALAGYIVSRRS